MSHRSIDPHRRVHRRVVQGLLAVVVGCAPFALSIPTAFATVAFGSVPSFPSPVTVGQTGIIGTLAIQNTSNGADAPSVVTLSSIDMVPACGTTLGVAPSNNCPAANSDPGVFTLSSTGTGQAGTACAGDIFTITVIDASTGQVNFNPGTTVVLQMPGAANSGDTCIIDFTFSVNKGPSHVDANGQVDQLGFASGTNALSHAGIGSGNNAVTVNLASPGIGTTASRPVMVGNTIHDSATLTAAAPPGPAPTGSIIFSAFGPGIPTCTGAAAFQSTVPVTGLGTYTSASFTTSAPGSYNWVAAYSGDVSNNPATSTCASNGETSTVNNATPSLVTQASATVPVGGTISDTATLAVGFNPTGTITFNLFGPNNATCTGAAVFTSTVAVAGNGDYSTGPFTSTAAGSYQFIATYSGDANNKPAGPTACNDPAESVTVTALPEIAVTKAASPSSRPAPGGTFTFTVQVSNPSTVDPIKITSLVDNVYGDLSTRAGSTCGALIGVTLAPGAISAPCTFTGPFTGISGDSQTDTVTVIGVDSSGNTATATAHATVSLTNAVPAITTMASSSVVVGGSITDTATLSGGMAPSGSITFNVFGPSNATCTGATAFTNTIPVTGNGSYTSSAFTPTAPGTYRFVVSYSGDTANSSASSACGSANESVVVAQANPALTTNASKSVGVGGKISDTATITGGFHPTGTVTFSLFGPNNATCTGTAIFTSTKPLPAAGIVTSAAFTTSQAGTYNFVTSYSGDANNTSVAETCGASNESVTVTKASTKTALTSSVNPSVFGQSLTLTATVTSKKGVPGGTVTFKDGATVLGTAPLSGTSPDTATLTTSSLSVGTHSLTASYGGNAKFAASTSAALAQTVTQAPTVMTATPAVLQLSPLGIPLFNLKATLARADNGTPVAGQTIRFVAGPTFLCQATTDSTGTATCAALASLVNITLNLGYTASFAGTTNYLPSSASASLVG